VRLSPPSHIAMSAAAWRFPEKDIKVFCTHCNSYVSAQTKYRHLKKYARRNHSPARQNSDIPASGHNEANTIENAMDEEIGHESDANDLEEMEGKDMHAPGE
jgi:HD-like signal output (HDOD) protein